MEKYHGRLITDINLVLADIVKPPGCVINTTKELEQL